MKNTRLIAALAVGGLLALEGIAMGQTGGQTSQTPPPYTYTPPLQPPPVTHQNRNSGLVVPAPFGGLYNILSGNVAPQRGGQQPLTPFNTPGQPVVTP